MSTCGPLLYSCCCCSMLMLMRGYFRQREMLITGTNTLTRVRAKFLVKAFHSVVLCMYPGLAGVYYPAQKYTYYIPPCNCHQHSTTPWGRGEYTDTQQRRVEIVLIYFSKVCFNEWEKSVSSSSSTARPVLVCA